jgi:predicted membrane channel-forming protein YqfA (hemolysin III family)
MEPAHPTPRTLVGIGLILLLIGVWAAFVASMARIVGSWPVLVQAPFYLVMGLAWIIPLKPLVRWIQTGSFRDGSRA